MMSFFEEAKTVIVSALSDRYCRKRQTLVLLQPANRVLKTLSDAAQEKRQSKQCGRENNGYGNS